ncbi:neutral/alkaline non-lysosomal ceramidase N-terminal domain-containing protein [Algoriphagus terrigena]|uniref:neutral/alkaline non-lysosomal ceramidase N-terminal domain-containing protein n=1 Tax=Algoriphagus terrigena TaxID=344884 RepID=UPI000420323A|nr:neutral/alkaline non-lysosomal ceramidase N-terminal domain-containing protein [Algoriphagus terrigena]
MLRKALKILAYFILAILILLVVLLKPVDFTPYFETDYYTETQLRYDSLTQSIRTENGAVSIGLSKVNLTPTLHGDSNDAASGKFIGIPLSGYGGREDVAQGVHDSIYVKSVALKVGNRTLVIVGSDLLIMPPDVSKKVSERAKTELGLDRSDLLLSATHTHSSIGAWSEGYIGESFNGPYNPDATDWIAQQVFESISLAIQDLKPGSIGMGSLPISHFMRNRLVGEKGKIDPDFMLIQLQQKDGKKALIGSYNAHATTLGGSNLEVSGDYPGYWQRKVEESDFDLAIFLAGSVGSHSYRNAEGEEFEKTKYLGEALADSVQAYLPTIWMKDSISVRSMTLEIDLPEFQFRITDGLRLRPFWAKKLFPDVGTVYLQATRLDSLVWGTTPSDFSGETTIGYKHTAGAKDMQAMVTSFNGAYTGYIIPCKYHHLEGYEPRLMNWFGPSYNSMINDLMGTMLEEIAEP